MGVSPEFRYEQNLKVLRRRDPSITSIFDQFSHVCVYHHNGEKWEKHGYEGSMFLYERSSFPPYGFYILNRMGMEDYVQRLYPEDDVGSHGSYLMLRSYPEFTRQRLAQLPHDHDKFSEVYKLDKNMYKPEQKGEKRVIGLWMYTTDAREPLIDVMQRLYKYVQENIPYPDEFRYGPEKQPPPNPHNVPGRTASAASTSTTTASTSSSNTLGGELATLFAKLTTTTTTPSVSVATGSPQLSRPKATTKLSMDDLFASVGGLQSTVEGVPDETTNPPGRAPTAPSTGIALLDSIFASAGPSSTPVITSSAPTSSPTAAKTKPQTGSHARTASATSTSTNSSRLNGTLHLPQQTHNTRIHSPQPTSSKSNGVLALTQAVVDGLLEGSGVGKGAFAGVNGMDASKVNGAKHKSNGRTAHIPPPVTESSEEAEGDDEILELDFQDTQALSDMSTFNIKKEKRRSKETNLIETSVTQTQAVVAAHKPLSLSQHSPDSNSLSSSALDALFESVRSKPAEPVVKVNGVGEHVHHHEAPTSSPDKNVKESLLDAIFASARSGHESPLLTVRNSNGFHGKEDLVRGIQKMLKDDTDFVDSLWEAYQGRERDTGNPGGSGSPSPGQKRRNRRRQGKNGVVPTDGAAA